VEVENIVIHKVGKVANPLHPEQEKLSDIEKRKRTNDGRYFGRTASMAGVAMRRRKCGKGTVEESSAFRSFSVCNALLDTT